MLKLAKPQAVLFDLDGTLIDSAPDIHAATNQMLAALGLPEASLAEVSQWIGNGSKKLVERALQNKYLEFIDADSNATFFNIAWENWNDAYRANVAKHTAVYDGVEACLERCEQLAIPMVLITNKPLEFTHNIVRGLAWETRFELILGGDSLQSKKPSPDPLLYACEQLQVSPESALMIGDSKNDIQAARAANMPVIAVSYGYNHGRPVSLESPDFVVASLEQVAEALA